MFFIYVDDNNRSDDKPVRRKHGGCDQYSDAVRVCKEIVNESVREFFDNDYDEDGNYDRYVIWGESPWIIPEPDGEHFSAFDYARERIRELIRLKPFLD
ncbi:MAG: hypothetical protein ABIH86_02845 [Planctomycetota bacterium]